MSLVTELKRRNVFRVAGLYLVGAWLITQVAGTVLPMFGAPGWVPRTIVIILAIGIIPALALAWAFELTPDGIRRDDEVPAASSIAPQTARRLNRLTVALLVLAVVYFGVDKFVLAPKRDASLVASTSRAVKAETAASAKAAVSDKSIAVLPFVDMSPEGDQEYFSDGIAEELLNRLAQIPELRVAARTSAFQFKGKNLDIADIGRQLNVAHVLEGSVRKSGTRLRITAQLINSASGYHLWSQTFEGDIGDVFKVQDEISVAITDALKSRLSGSPSAYRKAVTVDTRAYDDYLKGRAFTALRVGDNIKLAIAAFDRAIDRDPTYAAAHAGRAFALTLTEFWSRGLLPVSEIVKQTRASADKALELDPANVEAMISRGYVAMRYWDIPGAQRDFERAYALAPENVDVLNFYGDFQYLAGNLREAERLKRKAMALDPLSFVHPRDIFWAIYEQKKFAEALDIAKRGETLGNPDAHAQKVAAWLALGQFDQVEREIAVLCKKIPASCFDQQMVLWVATGQAAKARPTFEKRVAAAGSQLGPPGRAFIAGAYANDFKDVTKATQAARLSLGASSQDLMVILRWTPRGPLLPEEISQDPQWLAFWAGPQLQDLMTLYRKNILAFRQGG